MDSGTDSTAAPSDATTVDPEPSALMQARRLFADGDDAGVLHLAEAVDTETVARHRGALMRLIGLSALRQGDGGAARAWLEEAAPLLGDQDVALLVALGGACLAEQAARPAEVYFRRALTLAPGAVGANVGLAWALERRNDRVGALRAWRQAMAALVSISPAAGDAWMLGLPESMARAPVLALAQRYRDAGDPGAADDLLARLTALDPRNSAVQAHARPGPGAAWRGEDAAPALRRSPDAEHGVVLRADRGPEAPPDTPGQDGPHGLVDAAEAAARAGDRDRAVALYGEAGTMLRDDPAPPDDGLVALALGVADALRSLGDVTAASDLLGHLGTHRPHDPEVLRQRALTLHALDRPGEALALIETELRSHGPSSHVPLLMVHASLLRRADRLDDAVAMCRRAVEAAPGDAEPHRLLSVLLEQRGLEDEALATAWAALARDPALIWCHGLIARVLERRNQIDPAVEHYARALDIEPDSVDTHVALGLLLLKRGDWAAGWDEYEWRILKTDRPAESFLPPPWTGERLPRDGRLLVWHEMQGVVEALTFLRLAPAAARQAQASLVLEVDPRLVTPLARALPEATVLPFADPPLPATRDEAIVAQIPFGSLARLVGPDPANGVTDAPTLAADPDLVETLRARYLGGTDAALVVGICWSPLAPRRRTDRVVPLEVWGPVLETEAVRFVSVQPGPAAETDLARMRATTGADIVHDRTIDGTRDLDALAAQIAAMDLVVTADSLTAHLAGSLAVPGVLLLPFAPDWRWGLWRTQTAWYPSLRLVRQTRPGDWSGPIARAARALADYRDAARADAGGQP